MEWWRVSSLTLCKNYAGVHFRLNNSKTFGQINVSSKNKIWRTTSCGLILNLFFLFSRLHILDCCWEQWICLEYAICMKNNRRFSSSIYIRRHPWDCSSRKWVMVSDQVYGCNNYRAITLLAAGHSTAAGDQIHQCKQVSSLPKEICPAIHLYILCNLTCPAGTNLANQVPLPCIVPMYLKKCIHTKHVRACSYPYILI